MSEFKELIKSFSKSREYVRDFFVYGFKTRDEFRGFSGRTYDNERRRIESWLSDYVRGDYGKKGKNIYLSMDSNLLDTNPLYQVWKTKSFTDNDIMLHFYILDYLRETNGQTAEAITDGILDHYHVVFDPQMVRRKCNKYAKEGILTKEKQGREILYHLGTSFQNLFFSYPGLKNAVKLYQLSSPFGIAGNTIMENVGFFNNIFRIKHNFFVHTLEDEMLYLIIRAMREERIVFLQIKSTKSDQMLEEEGVPLKIFVSTRTGRRFLCYYSPKRRRFASARLDAVKKVEAGEVYSDYKEIWEKFEKNRSYAWGVSFQNSGTVHLEYVKLTLHICENSEEFILDRLKREGKGGVIRRIASDTFTYEIQVFDANEMLPWIRTFIGRIISLESDCPRLNQFFQRDFHELYRMYFEE